MHCHTFIAFTIMVSSFACTSSATHKPNILVNTNKEIYAIGDVHGDLDNLQKLLRRINIVDIDNHWIAENTILVQLGDQIDRGSQDKAVIDFFQKLKKEARLKNSNIFEILGNHETYSVLLDYKDVFISDDFLSYYTAPLLLPKRCQEFYNNSTMPWFDTPYYRERSTDGDPVPLGIRGRSVAFCPGGEYAQILSDKYVTLIINKTLFVHGEVTFKYSKKGRKGLEEINLETSNWLKDPNYISPLFPDMEKDLFRDKEGPFKSRYFSKDFNQEKCQILNEVLKNLDVDRMVVGHTIQPLGITSDCNGKIFRIDTGYSSGFYTTKYVDAPKEAIQIRGNNVLVLKDESWNQLFKQYQSNIVNSTIDCQVDLKPDINKPFTKCPRDLALIAFNYLAKIDEVYEDMSSTPDPSWYIDFSYQYESELPLNGSNSNSCYFQLADKIVVLKGKVKCDQIHSKATF